MANPKNDWIVEVFITLKPSVQDPQGATVQRELHTLGYTHLTSARLGKYMKLTFDGGLGQPEVEKQVKQMCDKLLANPVIEHYRFAVQPRSAGKKASK